MALTFWLKDGKCVVDATGKPILCATDPCADPVPASCPGGLGLCYKLSGYSDGDLTACPECDNNDNPTYPNWDGSFTTTDAGICRWVAPDARKIDGKWFRSGYYNSYIDLVESNYWQIRICCSDFDSGTPDRTIWLGRKAFGNTPAGIYTRISGCDTTTALTVVAC